MKTKGPILKFAILLCALLPAALSAQPPVYIFRNSNLQSGVALQQGAVYKFSNVHTNTDALVTIVGFTNGMTLQTFDVDVSGYMDAFQPLINCPANKKAYVEFRIDFVEHSNNSIAKTMTEVAMTGLDIDGFTFPSGKICEFNQFKATPSHYLGYNMSGSLTLTRDSSNWYQALNQPATFYSGIDTAAKDVMFSMISGSVSSISLRVGTDNKSTTNDQRQTSIYFRRFSFNNFVLASSRLKSFTGNANGSSINLDWSFGSLEHIKSVRVEKATNPGTFHSIGEIAITDHNKVSFSHTDAINGADKLYYRLAVVTADGKVTYSNILPFQLNAGATSFGVFPTAFNNTITLNVKSEKNTSAGFRLVNYTGNAVYQQSVNLYNGTNTISVNAGTKLPAGNYIAVLESDGTISTQKVMKL